MTRLLPGYCEGMLFTEKLTRHPPSPHYCGLSASALAMGFASGECG